MSEAPSTLGAGTRAVLLSLVPVVCPAAAWPLAEAIVDHMGLTLGSSPPLLGKGLALLLPGKLSINGNPCRSASLQPIFPL